LRNDIITIFVGFAKTIRRSFGFNLIKFTNKISPSQIKRYGSNITPADGNKTPANMEIGATIKSKTNELLLILLIKALLLLLILTPRISSRRVGVSELKL
jgi:hypothetical protein